MKKKNIKLVNSEKFFETLKKNISNLFLKDNKRKNKIRKNILHNVANLLLTDDERATALGLPVGCRIREGAKIFDLEKLIIGEYCWIGENAILDASGGLQIGSHCSIGPSVFIWSHTSHLTNLSMQNQINSKKIIRKKTTIGNGCFIAGPSVILPGVKVGNKVLIRPFSTVSKDIPDNSLVDGDKIKKNIFTKDFIDFQLKKNNV
jgi:acetyltransferase-like isoleucine patch superfamily enzyme